MGVSLKWLNMSFIETLTFIISIFEFFDALKRIVTEGRAYRRKRYGSVRGELYYWLNLLDTTSVQKYHLHINTWTKQEALEWRDSFKSRCEAIAVAAAIFASIGLTALQLESMPDTHWSASALVTASMALGVMAVISATKLQLTISRLSSHMEVRLWLSRGMSDRYDEYPGAYADLPLESSSAAVKITEAPGLLLNLSVLAYSLGFGLYLLYGWLWNVAPPASNFRNVFVFYVMVIGIVVIYVGVLWGGLAMDHTKVNQQFNTRRRFDTRTFHKKEMLLGEWTDVIDTLCDAKSEEEKDKARREMERIVHQMRQFRYNSASEEEGASYGKVNSGGQ